MSNVYVAVRCRPLLEREPPASVVDISSGPERISVRNIGLAALPDVCDSRARVRTFSSFSRLYGPTASQQQIFEEVGQQVLVAALKGYNVCVFAYGQTASGKTFTMMGDTSNGATTGLIPRVCASLLSGIPENQEAFNVDVSYLEIYNEKVRDLLTCDPSRSEGDNLCVREDPKIGAFVQGLSSHRVYDNTTVQALIDRGNSVRTTASTIMNERSSRSHAIFTLNFAQVEHVEDKDDDFPPNVIRSKIHFVDLAGSERISAFGSCLSHERMKERGCINKSLVVLGNVIRALVRRAKAGGARFSSKHSSTGEGSGSSTADSEVMSCVSVSTVPSRRRAGRGNGRPRSMTTGSRSRHPSADSLRGGENRPARGGVRTQRHSRPSSPSGSWSTATSNSQFAVNNGRTVRYYVPYRHSTLTWLLKNSLGGNSKMIMMACVSPSETCYTETVSTLRFAQTVQCLSDSFTVTVNEDSDLRAIGELKTEIFRLRGLISAAERSNSKTPASNVQRHDRVALLEQLVNTKMKAIALYKAWHEKWHRPELTLPSLRTNVDARATRQIDWPAWLAVTDSERLQLAACARALEQPEVVFTDATGRIGPLRTFHTVMEPRIHFRPLCFSTNALHCVARAPTFVTSHSVNRLDALHIQAEPTDSFYPVVPHDQLASRSDASNSDILEFAVPAMHLGDQYDDNQYEPHRNDQDLLCADDGDYSDDEAAAWLSTNRVANKRSSRFHPNQPRSRNSASPADYDADAPSTNASTAYSQDVPFNDAEWQPSHGLASSASRLKNSTSVLRLSRERCFPAAKAPAFRSQSASPSPASGARRGHNHDDNDQDPHPDCQYAGEEQEVEHVPQVLQSDSALYNPAHLYANGSYEHDLALDLQLALLIRRRYQVVSLPAASFDMYSENFYPECVLSNPSLSRTAEEFIYQLTAPCDTQVEEQPQMEMEMEAEAETEAQDNEVFMGEDNLISVSSQIAEWGARHWQNYDLGLLSPDGARDPAQPPFGEYTPLTLPDGQVVMLRNGQLVDMPQADQQLLLQLAYPAERLFQSCAPDSNCDSVNNPLTLTPFDFAQTCYQQAAYDSRWPIAHDIVHTAALKHSDLLDGRAARKRQTAVRNYSKFRILNVKVELQAASDSLKSRIMYQRKCAKIECKLPTSNIPAQPNDTFLKQCRHCAHSSVSDPLSDVHYGSGTKRPPQDTADYSYNAFLNLGPSKTTVFRFPLQHATLTDANQHDPPVRSMVTSCHTPFKDDVKHPNKWSRIRTRRQLARLSSALMSIATAPISFSVSNYSPQMFMHNTPVCAPLSTHQSMQASVNQQSVALQSDRRASEDETDSVFEDVLHRSLSKVCLEEVDQDDDVIDAQSPSFAPLRKNSLSIDNEPSSCFSSDANARPASVSDCEGLYESKGALRRFPEARLFDQNGLTLPVSRLTAKDAQVPATGLLTSSFSDYSPNGRQTAIPPLTNGHLSNHENGSELQNVPNFAHRPLASMLLGSVLMANRSAFSSAEPNQMADVGRTYARSARKPLPFSSDISGNGSLSDWTSLPAFYSTDKSPVIDSDDFDDIKLSAGLGLKRPAGRHPRLSARSMETILESGDTEAGSDVPDDDDISDLPEPSIALLPSTFDHQPAIAAGDLSICDQISPAVSTATAHASRLTETENCEQGDSPQQSEVNDDSEDAHVARKLHSQQKALGKHELRKDETTHAGQHQLGSELRDAKELSALIAQHPTENTSDKPADCVGQSPSKSLGHFANGHSLHDSSPVASNALLQASNVAVVSSHNRGDSLHNERFTQEVDRSSMENSFADGQAKFGVSASVGSPLSAVGSRQSPQTEAEHTTDAINKTNKVTDVGGSGAHDAAVERAHLREASAFCVDTSDSSKLQSSRQVDANGNDIYSALTFDDCLQVSGELQGSVSSLSRAACVQKRSGRATPPNPQEDYSGKPADDASRGNRHELNDDEAKPMSSNDHSGFMPDDASSAIYGPVLCAQPHPKVMNQQTSLLSDDPSDCTSLTTTTQTQVRLNQLAQSMPRSGSSASPDATSDNRNNATLVNRDVAITQNMATDESSQVLENPLQNNTTEATSGTLASLSEIAGLTPQLAQSHILPSGKLNFNGSASTGALDAPSNLQEPIGSSGAADIALPSGLTRSGNLAEQSLLMPSVAGESDKKNCDSKLDALLNGHGASSNGVPPNLDQEQLQPDQSCAVLMTPSRLESVLSDNLSANAVPTSRHFAQPSAELSSTSPHDGTKVNQTHIGLQLHLASNSPAEHNSQAQTNCEHPDASELGDMVDGVNTAADDHKGPSKAESLQQINYRMSSDGQSIMDYKSADDSVLDSSQMATSVANQELTSDSDALSQFSDSVPSLSKKADLLRSTKAPPKRYNQNDTDSVESADEGAISEALLDVDEERINRRSFGVTKKEKRRPASSRSYDGLQDSKINSSSESTDNCVGGHDLDRLPENSLEPRLRLSDSLNSEEIIHSDKMLTKAKNSPASDENASFERENLTNATSALGKTLSEQALDGEKMDQTDGSIASLGDSKQACAQPNGTAKESQPHSKSTNGATYAAPAATLDPAQATDSIKMDSETAARTTCTMDLLDEQGSKRLSGPQNGLAVLAAEAQDLASIPSSQTAMESDHSRVQTGQKVNDEELLPATANGDTIAAARYLQLEASALPVSNDGSMSDLAVVSDAIASRAPDRRMTTDGTLNFAPNGDKTQSAFPSACQTNDSDKTQPDSSTKTTQKAGDLSTLISDAALANPGTTKQSSNENSLLDAALSGKLYEAGPAETNMTGLATSQTQQAEVSDQSPAKHLDLDGMQHDLNNKQHSASDLGNENNNNAQLQQSLKSASPDALRVSDKQSPDNHLVDNKHRSAEEKLPAVGKVTDKSKRLGDDSSDGGAQKCAAWLSNLPSTGKSRRRVVPRTDSGILCSSSASTLANSKSLNELHNALKSDQTLLTGKAAKTVNSPRPHVPAQNSTLLAQSELKDNGKRTKSLSKLPQANSKLRNKMPPFLEEYGLSLNFPHLWDDIVEAELNYSRGQTDIILDNISSVSSLSDDEVEAAKPKRKLNRTDVITNALTEKTRTKPSESDSLQNEKEAIEAQKLKQQDEIDKARLLVEQAKSGIDNFKKDIETLADRPLSQMQKLAEARERLRKEMEDTKRQLDEEQKAMTQNEKNDKEEKADTPMPQTDTTAVATTIPNGITSANSVTAATTNGLPVTNMYAQYASPFKPPVQVPQRPSLFSILRAKPSMNEPSKPPIRLRDALKKYETPLNTELACLRDRFSTLKAVTNESASRSQETVNAPR